MNKLVIFWDNLPAFSRLSAALHWHLICLRSVCVVRSKKTMEKLRAVLFSIILLSVSSRPVLQIGENDVNNSISIQGVSLVLSKVICFVSSFILPTGYYGRCHFFTETGRFCYIECKKFKCIFIIFKISLCFQGKLLLKVKIQRKLRDKHT